MKNKNTIITFSVIAILLIILVFAILYVTTDLFKTNQQLFYKYITKINVIDTNFITQFDVASDKINNYTNSSLADTHISIAIANKETGISDIQEILRVKRNGLNNSLLNQTYKDFTFSNANKDIMTLKYIKDNNKYGVFSDNIVSKYLVVENKNLKDFFLKVGLDNNIVSKVPNFIPTNYKDILKIDEEILNGLKEKYGMIVYNSIDKSHFYKISNEDNTETIGISLTEQEFYTIIKQLLKMVVNDSVFWELINNKLQDLGYTDINIRDIQYGVQNNIEKIMNKEYSNEENFFKFSFVKKEEQITKIQFEIKNKMSIQEDSELIENNDIPLEDIIYKLEIDISNRNELIFLFNENNNIINKTIFNYSHDEDEINISIEQNYIYKEKNNSFKVQYQILDYNSNNVIKQNLIAKLDVNNEKKYEITFADNITLKEEVQISKLTTENSALLNEYSKEELNPIIISLINRINKIYGDDIEKILSIAKFK